MRQEGFTLVQLLLCIGLVGLLAHLAMPGLQALVLSQQRYVVAMELASVLRSARAEAVLRQSDVWVQAIDGNWGLGWWMLLDRNGQGAADPDNLILLERRASGQVPVVGNSRLASRVRFIAQGWPAQSGASLGNGTLFVCERGAAVSHWRVVMNNAGRVRVESGAVPEKLC